MVLVRFISCTILAILLAAPMQPALAEDIAQGDRVVLHALNALGVPLHREPRLSLFGRADDGTSGTVIETANEARWFHIAIDGGPTAWVLARYVEKSSATSSPAEAAWLALAALNWPSPQATFSGYDTTVRNALWLIYGSGGTTLYCRGTFTAIDAANHNANGQGLTWEHVFPANSVAQDLGFASRLCVGSAGPERDLCMAAVSDLENLWPAYSSINSSRRNFPYGELPGEGTNNPAFAVFCPDFERTYGQSPVYVEPTDAARGDIARSLIYMHFVYGLDLTVVVDDPNRLLNWLLSDPVDQAEVVRDQAIFAAQGTHNPLVYGGAQ